MTELAPDPHAIARLISLVESGLRSSIGSCRIFQDNLDRCWPRPWLDCSFDTQLRAIRALASEHDWEVEHAFLNGLPELGLAVIFRAAPPEKRTTGQSTPDAGPDPLGPGERRDHSADGTGTTRVPAELLA